MAVELIAPLGPFRMRARANGIDLIDLRRPLSYEAVVYRVGQAFEHEAPLCAMYWRNNSAWTRGRGFAGDDWHVVARCWTKKWMYSSFPDGRERLHVPRRGERLQEGSIVDQVRHRGRSLLVHTVDDVWGRQANLDFLFRTKSYGRDVAQVFVVAVEHRYLGLLTPQLQLVAPDERRSTFDRLFTGGFGE